MTSIALKTWFNDHNNVDFPVGTVMKSIRVDDLRFFIQLIDGRIMSGHDRGSLKLWDFSINIEGPVCTIENAHSGQVGPLFQLPNGRVVSAGMYLGDAVLSIWDIETRSCVGRVGQVFTDANMIKAFIQLSNGKLLCYTLNNLQIWDMNTVTCWHKIWSAEIFKMNILPLFGGLFATWNKSKLAIWNSETATKLHDIHIDVTFCVVQLHDGRIATGGETLKFWNVESGKCDVTLLIHGSVVVHLVQVSDSSRLISIGKLDCSIRIWDVKSGRCERTITGHTSPIDSIVPLSQSPRIVAAVCGEQVLIWDIAAGVCLATLHNDRMFKNVVQLADGRILSQGDNRELKVFDIRPEPIVYRALVRDASQPRCFYQWDFSIIHLQLPGFGSSSIVMNLRHPSFFQKRSFTLWNFTSLEEQRWIRRRALLLLVASCAGPRKESFSPAFRKLVDVQSGFSPARPVLVAEIARFL